MATATTANPTIATCTCGAVIEFVRTAKGGIMPLDLEPAADGRWAVVDGRLKSYDLEDRAHGRPRRRPHWAKCPDRDAHRRPTREGLGTCRVPDCSTTVPARRLMCTRHWFLVPSAIRAQVWAGYRGDPGADYQAAVRAALAAVAEAEAGRRPS